MICYFLLNVGEDAHQITTKIQREGTPQTNQAEWILYGKINLLALLADDNWQNKVKYSNIFDCGSVFIVYGDVTLQSNSFTFDNDTTAY